MPITSKAVSKLFFFLFALLALTNDSSADQSLPDGVSTLGGKKIIFDGGKFYSQVAGKKTLIQIPIQLKRALRSSSGVIFPEASARRSGDNNLILIVVLSPSSTSPTGYCGAGTEDLLYALELEGGRAKISFSEKVSSCLENIELTDDGQGSAFKSIKWANGSTDIVVSWARDSNGKSSIHIYRRLDGRYVRTN